MKEVAPHDRPREKLARLGSHGLGDNELLALVVGSGCRSADALVLANRVLAAVGGLSGLTRAAAGELCQVPGVGPARAGRIQAAVELGRRTLAEGGERPRLTNPRQLAALLLPRYGACSVEQFGVVLLDTKRRVIRIKVLSVGSLDTTVVHPREVFREAAAASAAAIALFHNHPSGDPAPSSDDLELTARMLRAGDVMGIDVVDHIILADQRYVSLSEIGGLIGRSSGGRDKMFGA
jgi:DNA repair protein RadC